MTAKLDLTSVTLCAADCVNPVLAARALALSMRDCVFGDAVLFSDRPQDGPFRVEPIEPIRSKAAYSRFVLRDLHRYVTTPFVLIVQWDGYVLDAGAWTREFLDYDYIGATWPAPSDRRVGNGGFSLRSRRLLQATASMSDADLPEDVAEDVVICKLRAPILEREHDIRFAPVALADRFSYEMLLPNESTFGFHGLFNMWRHLSDDEIVSLAASIDPSCIFNIDYARCMVVCFYQRRFPPLAALYARHREVRSVEDLRKAFKDFGLDETTIDEFLVVAEATMRPPSPTLRPTIESSGR